MRKIVLGLAAAALLAAIPRGVDAQVQIGPTLAFHDDFDFGIGATVSAQAPGLGEGIGFMADFIVFFPDTDGYDYFEINGNVTYSFPLAESTVLPFALGGLNIARASYDAGTLGDGSNTEIGLNLGGGIVFDAGSFRPAIGGRFEVNGGEGFVLFATLPFEVGGS
jgi:hypothetical protein